MGKQDQSGPVGFHAIGSIRGNDNWADAAMFIETEGTPNPATLKFLPGRYVMERGTADFTSPHRLNRNPLASELFALAGVARVFLGGDFITVTKTDEASWQALKPQVLSALMDHFVAGRPVIEGDTDEEIWSTASCPRTKWSLRSAELLDTRSASGSSR